MIFISTYYYLYKTLIYRKETYDLNKQLILSKTLIFVAVVAFIVFFNMIFSSTNTLVGVTSATAMLMFLQRDLTVSPLKNMFKLIGVNLIIGIGAFLASLNLWLALPINFIITFFIGYTFLYNLRSPLYLPFILQYAFLVATPVSTAELPLRLASLVAGAICIIGLQLLFNKNKLKKSGNKMLIELCNLLIVQIKQFKKGKDASSQRQSISLLISNLRKVIYERREASYYFTEEALLKLNLSIALENLSLLLNSNINPKEYATILDDLKKFLEKTISCIEDKHAFSNLDAFYTELMAHYAPEDVHNLKDLEFLNNIAFIRDTLEELSKLDEAHYNVVKRLEKIPANYSQYRFNKATFNSSSMKFSYAFRLAVGVTLSFFLTDFFHLEEGRWLAFTCISIIIPIYEQSKTKARDRIFATLIGGGISFFLFSFAPPALAPIILMASGYISSYLNAYRYTTIFTTISSIGSAALIDLSATPGLTVARICFVILGTIMALLINRFIFPYKLDDATNELKNLYKDTIIKMLEEVNALAQGKVRQNVMKNLLIITNLIEDRIRLNNQAFTNSNYQIILTDERLLISNIYELYRWLSKHKINASNLGIILRDMPHILHTTTNNYPEFIANIDNHLPEVDTTTDKVTLYMIKQIITGEHQLLTDLALLK